MILMGIIFMLETEKVIILLVMIVKVTIEKVMTVKDIINRV